MKTLQVSMGMFGMGTEVITEMSDRLLLSCSEATGDFDESYDEGATWSLTREHQNF